MLRSAAILLVVLAACVTDAMAQANLRTPNVGYLYPAGGRQDTSFHITAGGQFLRGADSVHVTGEGVRVTVERHVGRLSLSPDQRRTLGRTVARLWEEQTGVNPAGRRGKKRVPQGEDVPLPDHPLFWDLEDRPVRELMDLQRRLRGTYQVQRNEQLAEGVLLRVEIDEDAAPGPRELRLVTKQGMSNPRRFEVGSLLEVWETESNDPEPPWPRLAPLPPLDLPATLNGQIMPGDVDRWRFRAEKGQQLVFAAHARALVPYLADAVPGWFQPTLTLYDAAGTELAFADDYHFDPDPVLLWEAPANGVYTLEVRDAIYRGREDFVYRVSAGELPFITSSFPPGATAGAECTATVDGVNLRKRHMALDTRAEGAEFREACLRQRGQNTNPIHFAVDGFESLAELEPNNDAEDAQPLELARAVNGRIDVPGDVDCFRFQGHAGQQITAEVVGRRVRSPIDAALWLLDGQGKVLAWNDDAVDKQNHLHRGPGLLTHHADPFLGATLPSDGAYTLRVGDVQRQGGEAVTYRLRLAQAQPDFELRVTPSSVSLPLRRSAELCVHVLRKDGFDGAIDLSLHGAPAGVSLQGARIPAGEDKLRLTLTADRGAGPRTFALELEGSAEIGGETVKRLAEPADDVMQAFLWRHLRPAEVCLVALQPGRGAGRETIRLAEERLRVTAGGVTRGHLTIPSNPALKRLELVASDPPAGLSLKEVHFDDTGLAFELHAGPDAPPSSGNVILHAFLDTEGRGRQAGKKVRVAAGVMPAIPYEIVAAP